MLCVIIVVGIREKLIKNIFVFKSKSQKLIIVIESYLLFYLLCVISLNSVIHTIN